MKKFILAIIAFAFISIAQAQTSYNVTVSSNVFTPANITINQGDTIIWTNVSGFHNVNGTTTTYPSNPASFGNAVGTGWTYSFVFNTPGFYDYRCDPHFGVGMFGTVTVIAVDNTNDDWVTSSGVTSITTTNVAIGTGSPIGLLHVFGDMRVGAGAFRVNNSNGFVGFGTNTPNRPMHFFLNNSSTQGQAKLEQAGTGDATFQFLTAGNFWSVGVDQSQGDNFAIQNNTSLNSGAAFSISKSTGFVGIGTTVPGGQFELSLDQGRKPSTNTWTVTSDERLKNISGAYEKGLDEIVQLEPITYTYKNVGERKFAKEVLATENVGFSAQEVQKVFPEAVGTDDDGYLNFNMHAILVAQVNAIKEQQKQIEELRNSNTNNVDVAALLNRLETLENKLSEKDDQINSLLNQMAQFDLDLQQCCLSHQTNGTTGSTQGLDDKAHLAQNVPNPFNQRTIIKYYLPKNSAQAQIRISDMKGNLLRVVEVYEKGYGHIEIESNILAPGTYVYELHVGNNRIDTKRMLIQK